MKFPIRIICFFTSILICIFASAALATTLTFDKLVEHGFMDKRVKSFTFVLIDEENRILSLDTPKVLKMSDMFSGNVEEKVNQRLTDYLVQLVRQLKNEAFKTHVDLSKLNKNLAELVASSNNDDFRTFFDVKGIKLLIFRPVSTGNGTSKSFCNEEVIEEVKLHLVENGCLDLPVIDRRLSEK